MWYTSQGLINQTTTGIGKNAKIRIHHIIFKALIFYHLEEYSSGSPLLQVLEKDDFAKSEIVSPQKVFKKVTSLMLSITEGLSNYYIFSRNFKQMSLKRYQRSMLILEILTLWMNRL
jgi:transposase, IS4 family